GEAGLEHDRARAAAGLFGRLAVDLDQLWRTFGIGHRPEPVAVVTGDLRCARVEGRDVEQRRLCGPGMQVGPLCLEEPAVVVDALAVPEPADQSTGFLEGGELIAGPRPG